MCTTPTQRRGSSPYPSSTRKAEPNRVKAVLRVRPPTTADRGNTTQALFVEGNTVRVSTLTHGKSGRESNAPTPERYFQFDHVTTGEQPQVYDIVGRPLLLDALQGYNVCLFAYGQTGSGKTHSLQGDEANEGVIPRLIRDVFVQGQAMCNHDCTLSIKVTLSLFEIYNEKIRDLLVKAPDVATALDLTEGAGRKVQVKGLSRHTIVCADHALALLTKANGRRQVGFTMMNSHSSRSHLVMQLTVTQTHQPCTAGVRDMESVITVTDLAGSDRASKTEATGDTFRESKNINQSLLMLGRSLNSISEGNTFVPSRESKMTRLLAAHLQGNCKTMMLATVSPTAFNVTESIHTMEFAQNAAAIKTVVRANSTVTPAILMKELILARDTSEARCRELEQQLQELKEDRQQGTAVDGVLKVVTGDQLMATEDVTGSGAQRCSHREVGSTNNPGTEPQAEVSRLSALLAERTREVEMLTSQARACASDLAARQATIQDLCTERAELRRRHDATFHALTEAEATRHTLQVTECLLQAANARCETLQSQKCALETEVATLRQTRPSASAQARAARQGMQLDASHCPTPVVAAHSPSCVSPCPSQFSARSSPDLAATSPPSGTTPASCAGAPMNIPDDDQWLASDPTKGTTPGARTRTSTGATTPTYLLAGSTTPRLCALGSDLSAATPVLGSVHATGPETPYETISISSDSDKDTPPRHFYMLRRSTLLQRSGARPTAPPRMKLEPGTATTELEVGASVTMEISGRRSSGQARRSLGRHRLSTRAQRRLVQAVVTGREGPGLYLVRLSKDLSKATSTQVTPDHQRSQDCRPNPHPSATRVSRGSCKDCDRRLTGYQLFAQTKRPSVRRRHSTHLEAERQLGQQWRRLTIQTQQKYNRMAEKTPRRSVSPLCTGTYNTFAAEQRMKLRAKHPHLHYSVIQRRVSAMWRTMPYPERKQYSLHKPKA